MAEKEILIRKAVSDDIDGIFYLYAKYMFDSCLLRTGGSFVKNYLKVILESKNCVTFVAGEDHIIGFIMATFNCKKISSELFFNIGILCAWIRQVLLRPSLVFENLELMSYPSYTRLKNVNAELLFIAIDPAYRRKEVAVKLINETLDLMRQKGIKKVKVSTLVKNEAVNALLKKLGFETKKPFRLFKKDMSLYTYELDEGCNGDYSR